MATPVEICALSSTLYRPFVASHDDDVLFSKFKQMHIFNTRFQQCLLLLQSVTGNSLHCNTYNIGHKKYIGEMLPNRWIFEDTFFPITSLSDMLQGWLTPHFKAFFMHFHINLKSNTLKQLQKMMKNAIMACL